jgi:predicted Zn-dependent peptidase
MGPIVYRRAAMRNTARNTAIGTATAWALALTAAAGSAASQQAAPRADAQLAPAETVTAQGLRIWSLPGDPGGRFVIGAIVGAGSRDDPESGVACLLQRVLVRSTTAHARLEDEKRLAAHGGVCASKTTHESTWFRVDVPGAEWRFAIDWLAEHLLQPAFLYEDVVTERNEIYQEINGGPGSSQPTYEGLLYGVNALGHSVTGDHPGNIEIRLLRDFHTAHYRSGNMAFAFAGAAPEPCRAAVAAAFAPLPTGGTPPEAPKAYGWTGRSDWPGGQPRGGGAMVTGYHLPDGTLTDQAVLTVLADYLARGRTDLEDAQQGRTAVAVSELDFRDGHRLQFEVTVDDRRRLPGVYEAINGAVAALRAPSAKRIEEARSAQTRLFRIDAVESIDRALLLGWLAHRKGAAPDQLQSAIELVTAADIANYARHHLTDSNRFTISNWPVGPALETWVVIVVLLGLAAAIDAWFGFRVVRGLIASLAQIRRRRRRRRAGAAPAAAPETIQPGDADELIRNIQRYFDKEKK